MFSTNDGCEVHECDHGGGWLLAVQGKGEKAANLRGMVKDSEIVL